MAFYTSCEKYGNFLLHTYYKDGKRKYEKVKYKPYLFVENEQGEYTALMDRSKRLTKKYFDNIKAQKEWLDEYKDVTGFNYYGIEDVIGQFIAQEYPGKIEFDPTLINMVSLDIETSGENGFSSPDDADAPITCLTCKSSKSKKYWLFYYEENFTNDESVTGIPTKDILAMKCKDEADMLRKFVAWWKNDYPDVISGWNVDGYDIPYIVNRIKIVIGERYVDMMSPWEYVKTHTYESFGSERTTYRFAGITVLDYMEVFKKFGVLTYGTPASFKLDHIAYVILKDRKVDYHTEYGDLHGLWTQNKNLYYQYNIKDTALIQRFEDETSLISLVYSVAYDSGVNLIDALGTVFLWDNIINRFCLEEMVVVPKSPKRSAGGSLMGGYVMPPHVGLHKNVVSFDLASLYPHLMMQYNISPETYRGQRPNKTIEYFMDENGENPDLTVSMCANGATFTNEFRGIIPRIIDVKYKRRSTVKKEMLEWEQKEADGDTDPRVSAMISSLDNEQMAIKVQMNGLYGAIGNENFRYFMLVIAEGITTSGQLSVKWAGREVNASLNEYMSTKDFPYLIYTDTDSIYLNLDGIVKKEFGTRHPSRDEVESFLDKFSKEYLTPVINAGYDRLKSRTNAFENKMVMKREKICGSAIFVAKKRYCLLVYNNEGVHYTEPKVSVTGIEAVRSNTPEVCKDALVESFRVMLTSGEVATQKYIEGFKKEFMKCEPGEVARITGVKGINDYRDPETGSYKKGCPIHVRASYVHNNLVKKLGMENKIQPIVSGDKIKYTYLKMPNPVREDIIAFVGDTMPKEFGLEDYIDYQVQFEKVFVGPVKKVMEACNWSPEHVDTLEDFFS